MDRLKIDTCPLCGGRRLEYAMTCTDYYASGEKFEVIRCAHCGFQMTQDVPVESEIGRYYEVPDYISHSNTRKGLMNRVYHLVRRVMLSRKALLVKNASKQEKGALLDYGTGTGYFADTMARCGWKVSAIEKSAKAREFAKIQFGLNVESEKALDSYADGSFDVVTLWHVMEHLEHLNEMWNTLHRLLRNGGSLILAVPNSDSYDAQKYGNLWAAYDVPRHLWHFSPSVMKQFGIKHNFKLEKSYPMPMDAFYVSMLSERYKGSRLSFLKGLWMGMLAWFNAIGNKERSSSMIYVFRKK